MLNAAVWKTYTDVGCSAYLEGNFKTAQDMFEAALKQAQDGEADYNDSRLGTSFRNLALALHMQGEYKKAEPLFRRALVISERLLGKNHARVAENLDTLSELYIAQGKYQKAKFFCQRTVQVLSNIHGKNFPDLVPRLERAAWVCHALGKEQEAVNFYTRAHRIKQQQGVFEDKSIDAQGDPEFAPIQTSGIMMPQVG